MEIRITKRQKLYEMNNDMCHNYYYLIHGRIYNDDLSAYRKFKFVVWFDIFDVIEMYRDDDDDTPLTKEDFDCYLDDCIWAMICQVKSYDDERNLKYFYEDCNESIKRYNEVAKHW